MRKRIFTGQAGKTVADTKYSFINGDKNPKGAPNIVYIVIDDMGYSDLGCYGSEIDTPNIDRMASEGLRYNNFHTTAICSATRASLLTGANHHAAGVNAVIELGSGTPNGLGYVDHQYALLSEILKEYDYDTLAVGKWHLTDAQNTTQAGPFTDWPLGRGFDRYYGYLQAQIDQFHPSLIQDNSFIPQPKQPEEGYHLSEDLTDKAIEYIFTQKSAYPENPFFLYLAYGAVHAPHQAPKEYIDRYKGRFDEGWDKLREKRFARQKELSILPENAVLTERSPVVTPWDELPDDYKKLYTKYMEAFAGFLTHTDDQIGRVIDYLREIGQLDNTILVFLSDNGASPEGGKEGRFNVYTGIDATSTGTEANLALPRIDEIGTPTSNNHYPHGWAHLGNTPFKWYKTWVHSGGVKDALIIRYPGAVKDAGGIRDQLHHVSDITPAVLDLIGIKKPDSIKGVKQKPFTGTSLAYTLGEPDAKGRKTVQYFEMMGNRAIYKDGWKAVVNHAFNDSYDDDVWELYNVAEDFSEAHNVADKYTQKLKELQEAFEDEAAKNNVYPLLNHNMHAKKLDPASLAKNLKNLRLDAVRKTYGRIVIPVDTSIDNSFLFQTAYDWSLKICRRSADEQGVLVATGDRFGGFSLYIRDNTLKYVYNAQDYNYYTAEVANLPIGEIDIKVEFRRVGLNNARAEIYVNGEKAAAAEIGSLTFRLSYYTTIGENKFWSVTSDYDAPFTFSGEILGAEFYAPEFDVKAMLAAEKLLAGD